MYSQASENWPSGGAGKVNSLPWMLNVIHATLTCRRLSFAPCWLNAVSTSVPTTSSMAILASAYVWWTRFLKDSSRNVLQSRYGEEIVSRLFVALMCNVFSCQYAMIHRLETNKLRNTAKFFAHLLSSDALPWSGLEYIQLNEVDTTSSSRIFIKIVFQVRNGWWYILYQMY